MDWDFFANDHSITVPEVKDTFKGLASSGSIAKRYVTRTPKRLIKFEI